ncbi:hypothetical protein KW784_00350, partial [Candidatus Parcubacteria bacterium]|nr:hypothetical protein [Candidatus Parcubacteria bacterium]
MELDIFSHGKEYISASRAAKKTGYASDYIGQLCRGDKIPGKLIGRTWYVDLDSLLAHKRNRQLGKPRKVPTLQTSSAKRSSPFKIQADPVEIFPVLPFREIKVSYLADDAPLLPELVKKVSLPPVPAKTAVPGFAMAARATVVAFSLVLILFGGLSLIESQGGIAKRAASLGARAASAQFAVASVFDAVSNSAEFLLDGFRNLRQIAFGAPKAPALPPPAKAPATFAVAGSIPAPEAPLPHAVQVASTAKPPALAPDAASLKSELKAELEAYIRTQISLPVAPRITYNTTVLRQDILSGDTKPAIVLQSDSGADLLGLTLSKLQTNGTFVTPTITGASLIGFTFTGATGTSATTTNFYSGTGTFDSLSVGSTSGGLTTLSRLLVNGSTTLQDFTGTNSTTTNATSSTFAITGNGSGLTFYGSGNHDVTAAAGTLRIGSNTILGNILPLDSTIDIGASGMRFDKIYADEINASTIVGTISGGNVSAESIRINSDNATADAEDSFLDFERGTLLPNALLTWDSTNKRFTMNAPLALMGGIGNGDLLVTGSTTLQKVGATYASTTEIQSTSDAYFATSGGYVGIGTASPKARLHVSITDSATSIGANSTQIGEEFTNLDTTTNNWTTLLFNSGSVGAAPSAIIGMQNVDPLSHFADFAIATRGSSGFGERFRVTSNGNVGIGTTTPNNKLDIFSTTRSALGFSGASGDTYKWTIGMDVPNGGRFSIASSTALGTLDRLVIDGSGNVGIGTTNPGAKLQVNGSFLALGSTTLQDFTATQGTITSATSTNFTAANILAFGSSTLFSAKFNSATGTNLYATNFLALGSTTLQNATGSDLYISGLASTTQLRANVANIGNLTVTACTGCGSGSSFAYPFTSFADFGTHNATTSLLGFRAGFYSLASSTIGNNTASSGLTINGGATTTGDFLHIGSTTLQ